MPRQSNPVREQNTWIVRQAVCDFIVNVALDEKRRIAKVVAGDMEAAFLEVIEKVRPMVQDSVPEPVDNVVTSSAGYPLDTTFYQSIKGMVVVAPIVKPGGTVILAASLSEGIGRSKFQQLFQEHATLDAFMERILAPEGDYFVMEQWQL